MRRLSAATFVLAILGASAASSAELHLGRCHMDYCSWFSIEETDLTASNANGALFKVVTRGWSSHHPDGSYGRRAPRKGGETSTWFIFCSKTTPALLFPHEGRWLAHILAPGGENSVFGYNESSHKQYFAVCHRVSIGDVYSEMPGLAQRLGYPRTTRQSDQIELKDVRDIMNLQP
jgi:hypothetical protein